MGEHAFPPAVSVQVTPLFDESFCMLAFNVTAAAPAVIVVIGFVMLTVMAWTTGAEIVKESVADADVFAAEVAVIVGASFGDAGTVAGGV